MAFKTRQQVAHELGISPRTLSRWIKRERLDVKSGLLSPREQGLILHKFGFINLQKPVPMEIEPVNHLAKFNGDNIP